MYVAHTELKRKEISREILKQCLASLQEERNDNARFSVILTITEHVRSNSFTADDRATVLKTIGFDFLKRLATSKSPLPGFSQDVYKCAVVSILSVWTVEPYIAQHSAMRDFLAVVNDVLSSDSLCKRDLSTDSHHSYEQMCEDCETIVSNLSKHESGVEHLLQAATLDLMFKHATSPSCQNVGVVLATLSSIVKTRGESCLNLPADTFYSLLSLAVDRLQQGQDIKEKAKFARILTSFLTGVSTVEITLKMDCVVKLVQVLQKLVAVKMPPGDSQAVLGLVSALVSTAGPRILGSDIGGNYNFLKTVVALVYVEVYMQLDHISLDNATDRSRHIDGVYKLLTSIVRYVAESGESMDSDTVIAVYRKLVQICDTIMEFVYCVANQEVELQRNHIVVLLSVRALAAMLSEITEDVTPRLLELLPFFNFLCQNVEYSDDVVVEVKSLTQAALTNIKSITAAAENSPVLSSELVGFSSEHSSLQDESVDSSCCEFSNKSQNNDREIRVNDDTEKVAADELWETSNNLGSLNIDNMSSSECIPSDTNIEGSGRMKESENESSTLNAVGGNSDKLGLSFLAEDINVTPTDQQLENNFQVQNNHVSKEHNATVLEPELSLSQESVDRFRDFQTSGAKPQKHSSARKVSFKNKATDKSSDQVEADQLEQWRPMPNDVLGYLLPAYVSLMDNEEALEVMVQGEVLQTVVNFLKTSFSHLLENQSSGYPDITTINALSVIEQVYLQSPASAAALECLEDLFEISILSLPNILCLPHPPPLVCLKLLEVALSAYRLQGRDKKRKSSLPWLKHSQSRFFKAAIEYMTSFYEFRQQKGRPLSLHFQDNSPLAEDFWSGCIAGLCALVRSVVELQHALVKSSMLPNFLSFLAQVDGLSSCSQKAQMVVESLCCLVEASAESSDALLRLVLDNQGQNVASKFFLHKLTRLCPSDHNNDPVKAATVS